MMKKEVYIISAVRTAIGSIGGSLSSVEATKLGAAAIEGALKKGNVNASDIDEVYMGMVLQANAGQAPARQAAKFAGVPDNVPCTTVNKVCASGMKSVIFATQGILLGDINSAVAGGMESMSNAPLLLRRSKKGQEAETEPFADHVFLDGLEDAYQANTPMGVFAEATAAKYGFSREAQDQFAIDSLLKAQKATEEKAFEAEIVPIIVQTPHESFEVDSDENLGRATVEKIQKLKPVFLEEGTITAASASGIADGAAAVLLTRAAIARQQQLPIRARIVGMAAHSQEPAWFTLAPIEAIQKVLHQTGWSVEDVDLFEINEAFAVVPMAAMRDLGIPDEKLNVYGGACAMGHPIGASGARIVVTLLNALERLDKKRGIAAICIGGGEALAIALER
jgi:acetyl-CoA C-acetyltransferase